MKIDIVSWNSYFKPIQQIKPLINFHIEKSITFIDWSSYLMIF